MIRIGTRVLGAVALLAAPGVPAGAQQERIFRVDLAYRAPGNGPTPNFSPKGTQVALTDVAAGFALPDGAVLPAKRGIIKDDEWSVLEAGAPDAQKRVLSYDEARPTLRLMFVKTGGKELVLEFRSFVKRYAVTGYPTIVVLDSAGKETSRLVGYQSSKEVLAILK